MNPPPNFTGVHLSRSHFNQSSVPAISQPKRRAAEVEEPEGVGGDNDQSTVKPIIKILITRFQSEYEVCPKATKQKTHE
jgi:hypothetical protein